MVWAQVGVEDACDQNPSFEPTVTTGWTFLQTNGATVLPDLTTAKHGLVSARIAVPGTAGGYSAVRYRSVGDVFWLADKYSATFWARASRATEFACVIGQVGGSSIAARTVAVDTTWRQY